MSDIYIAPKKETSFESGEKPVVGQTSNPLSAFALNPVDVKFENQEQGEKIILLLRKHWITNLTWIIPAILLLFAPLALRFFPLLDFLPLRYQMMAIILWYLLVIAFIFEEFLTWFFDVNIITNKRVVDIDFYNLVYKEVSEAQIERIQDVTFNMGGVIRVLFGFGDVLIQTAGTLTNFEFKAVPRPSQVAQVLGGLRAEQKPI